MKKTTAKKADLKEVMPSWDLSVAFYDGIEDPQIDEDVTAIKKLINSLARFEGKLGTLAPYEFEMFMSLYENFVKLLNKVYRFAHLYSDTQKTDQRATALMSQLNAELDDEMDKIHFIYYELSGLSWDKRIELMNSPKLSRYIPWMQRVFSNPPSEDDEGYLYDVMDFIQEKKSATDADWSNLYDKICSAMVFTVNGKNYNDAEARALKNSTHDAKLKEAIEKEMSRVYTLNAPVITSIFNSILKNEDVDAKLNGYYNAEQASSVGNVVPREHLLELVSAVCDSFYPVSRKYYALLDKLNKSKKCYSANNPIKVPEKKYSWAECKKIVLEAYNEFSPLYAQTAKSIINANIIDVEPKEGKKSGAYCMSGAVPYIFLNFVGTEDDVNTFAHELGHGVNHVLAATQGVLNDRTPISLAEVASEFAEFLLFNKLFTTAVEKGDMAQALHLAIGRMDDMVATIHRQIALYNFEKRAHAERQDGELSTERLGEIWAEEYERYTGKKLEGDARNEWMYVSHFFNSPFYVYCYAFAGFIVNNLVKVYRDDELEHQEIFDFPTRFMHFLTNSGIEFYPELLEAFEIDVNDPSFWKNGVTEMKALLNLIEDLVEEQKLLN